MERLRPILLAAFFMLICPNLLGQAKLEIEISNIRSSSGQILVSLFNSPDQFPRNAPKNWKNIQLKKDNLKNKTLKMIFESLTPGSYVVALLDDENGSGDMENTKLGIPLEGFGFSNNAKPILSCPPYRKCKFEIKDGVNKIKIDIIYKKNK